MRSSTAATEKIHILADRVNSVAGHRAATQARGLSLGGGGKLRVEYGQLLAAIGRKIPSDRMQEIIADTRRARRSFGWRSTSHTWPRLTRSRPSGGNSSTRSAAAASSLRRPDRVHGADIRAFLSRHSSARPEQRPPTPPSFRGAARTALRENKPKGPQRSSWDRYAQATAGTP